MFALRSFCSMFLFLACLFIIFWCCCITYCRLYSCWLAYHLGAGVVFVSVNSFIHLVNFSLDSRAFGMAIVLDEQSGGETVTDDEFIFPPVVRCSPINLPLNTMYNI